MWWAPASWRIILPDVRPYKVIFAQGTDKPRRARSVVSLPKQLGRLESTSVKRTMSWRILDFGITLSICDAVRTTGDRTCSIEAPLDIARSARETEISVSPSILETR